MRTILLAIVVTIFPAVAGAQPGQSQIELAPDTVVAVIDGIPITLQEVSAAALTLDARRLFSLNQQLYAVRERALAGLIGERLLARRAKEAGMSVEAYVNDLPVEPIDERDVDLMTAGAHARNPAIDLGKLRELVREHLRDQKRDDARRRHIDQLKLEHKKAGRPIVIDLRPPRIRVPVADGDPVQGSGPVEIVEFSDFECPYCQKAQPMVREVMARYEGQVRLIWKDFPLPEHQHAVAAAVAARCAQDQGRFWQYHDTLFANQQALAPSDLRQHARAVGLDVDAFDACIRAGKHQDAVASMVENAQEHLVEVTPTFLVNGRVVQGAVPFYEMAAIIDQELEN